MKQDVQENRIEPVSPGCCGPGGPAEQAGQAKAEEQASKSEAREFRLALNDAYRRFQALERGEKRCFGVTMSQCVTVEMLWREGSLGVRQLAERLGLDTSTVTRTLDVLVRDGIVRRRRDEERDRRQVFVSLTDQGLELAEKLQNCADLYCQRILQQIPADRRDDVLHALRVLGRALADLPESCG